MPIGLSIVFIIIGLVFVWAGKNVHRYKEKDCTGLPTAMATVSYNNAFSEDDRYREYHTLQTFKLPTGEDAIAYDAMQNAVSFFKWPKRFKNPMEGTHEIYYWPHMVPNKDTILGFPNILKQEGEGDFKYPGHSINGVQIKYESRFVDETLYDAMRYKGRRHKIAYFSLAIFFFFVAIAPHFIGNHVRSATQGHNANLTITENWSGDDGTESAKNKQEWDEYLSENHASYQHNLAKNQVVYDGLGGRLTVKDFDADKIVLRIEDSCFVESDSEGKVNLMADPIQEIVVEDLSSKIIVSQTMDGGVALRIEYTYYWFVEG